MKKLAIAALVISSTVAGWRALRSDAHDPKLVFDRFWVDHAPRHGKDQFHALFVMGDHPWGHFAVQTPWHGQWEGFHYHVLPREEGAFELLFPDAEQRERVTLRVSACSEQGFDYCLDVTGSSRGAKRYYSKKVWGNATEPAEIFAAP